MAASKTVADALEELFENRLAPSDGRMRGIHTQIYWGAAKVLTQWTESVRVPCSSTAVALSRSMNRESKNRRLYFSDQGFSRPSELLDTTTLRNMPSGKKTPPRGLYHKPRSEFDAPSGKNVLGSNRQKRLATLAFPSDGKRCRKRKNDHIPEWTHCMELSA